MHSSLRNPLAVTSCCCNPIITSSSARHPPLSNVASRHAPRTALRSLAAVHMYVTSRIILPARCVIYMCHLSRCIKNVSFVAVYIHVSFVTEHIYARVICRGALRMCYLSRCIKNVLFVAVHIHVSFVPVH